MKPVGAPCSEALACSPCFTPVPDLAQRADRRLQLGGAIRISPVQDFSELADHARKASDVLKALSHETRLMILWLLSVEEKNRFPNWKSFSACPRPLFRSNLPGCASIAWFTRAARAG
jgi:hypothetical protein